MLFRSIDYISEKGIEKYVNMQSITFESGLLLAASENTRIGIHVFNPVPNSLRKTAFPLILRIGAGRDLSKLLFAGIETEMSSGKKLIARTGFEYEAGSKLWIRGGFSTNNSSFSFGLGYLAEVVLIDFSFTTHERLGVTSSASLIFIIR